MLNKKVLITGGLGFIGSNLAKKCLELGADVEIFSSTLEKEININDFRSRLKVTLGDITNYGDVKKAVVEKDFIFHLAGQTSHLVAMENPYLDIDANLVGTINVLEACRKLNKGAKILGIGTISQVGLTEKESEEGLKDDPVEIYSANKLITEKYFQIYNNSYGVKSCFLRLSTVYGQRQRLDNAKRGITNYFIGRLFRGEDITVYGKGDFIREYLHIDDVVDALILAAVKDVEGVFVLGGDRMKFIEMASKCVEVFREITGKEGKMKFVEFPEYEKKIDAGNNYVNCLKAKEVLGWYPKTRFEQGIKKTINYYLKENKLEGYLKC